MKKVFNKKTNSPYYNLYKNKNKINKDTINNTTNDFVSINNTINIYDNCKEYIQLIDYNEYRKNIIQSYHFNNTAVINQFNKDFPRSSYYISNTKEKDIELFKDYFEFLLYQKHLNYYEFIMFLTQAVMGIPLEILSKDLHPSIYIGEINSLCNPLSFKITTDESNNNNIQLHISKNLRYFSINNKGQDKTLNTVNIKIFIPFSTKDKIIITYKILKNNKISII